MDMHEWNALNEADFDAVLSGSLSELPPEDVIDAVTPWKRAVNRILVGIALSTVTLNFLCLNYILPAVGMLLVLLGFRSLRRENRSFAVGYVLTMLRALLLYAILVCNATIYGSALRGSTAGSLLSFLSLLLQFAQLICFLSALQTVREKAALPRRVGTGAALVIWYLFICLLALIQYRGLIIAGAMLIAYFFLLRSLYRLSGELDGVGYAVQTAPVRLSDGLIAAILAALLLVGCVCGYLFGSSYPMDWTPLDTDIPEETADVRAELLALGFPEYVLNDLRPEEIAACEGALQVVSTVWEHPVNEGREVTTREPAPDGSGNMGIHVSTVYDVKELRITGVAVQLPGERERWMLFQHFLWDVNPGFCGTESIQLWPADRILDGWRRDGDIAGRVLYDDNDGNSYTAPYHFLGTKNYVSNSIFFGEQNASDFFAAFSLPDQGQNQRGYLVYPILAAKPGCIVDSWINYTHQRSLLQYPAMSAMEKRMTNGWSDAGAFITVQDALQFFSYEDGARPLR